MSRLSRILMVVFLGGMTFAGCQGQNNTHDQKTIKLAYVNWADGIALTNLAKVILEDKMGYQVKMTVADVAPVFTSVAQGDNDAFLDVWLPVTHESYLKEYGKDLVDLGYNYKNARIGLVVPDYVTINDISELNGVKDTFRGEIIGIDSGAGIMKTTEKAIEAYGLDLKLLPSSGPAMAAALKGAIEKKEWIVVTGWKPHWKFARWDLKFLNDPKNVYGAVENIHTVVRKGFDVDHPDVVAFFKNFVVNDQQLGGLMDRISSSDGDPAEAARMWVKENEALVQSWLPKS